MSTAVSATPQMPISEPLPQSEDWKGQLAQRVESYRAKMGGTASETQDKNREKSRNAPTSSPRARTSNIARSVASRYAARPSYRELMEAAEAEYAALEQRRALEQARANHAAQEEELRDDCVSIAPSEQDSEVPLSTHVSAAEKRPFLNEDGFDPYGPSSQAQPGTAIMPQFAERSREMRLHHAPSEPEPSLEDLLASSLVEPRAWLPSKLIEFPRELVSTQRARPHLPDPPPSVIPPYIGPPHVEPVPVDPRYAGSADGSCVEATGQGSTQLRIFEVEPESYTPDVASERLIAEAPQQVVADLEGTESAGSSMTPQIAAFPDNAPIAGSATEAPFQTSTLKHYAPDHGSSQYSTREDIASRSVRVNKEMSARNSGVRAFRGVEWAAISLDKDQPAHCHKPEKRVSDAMAVLQDPASIDRRVMAFAVDFAAVTAGFIGFLVVFVASTPHLPKGLTAIVLAGAVYASLWVLYQMLFFSLSGATAGMLYARIALCTFDDRNPSRTALRRRLAAWWLSCLPLGLGFLWSFLDEDNLCWHDRMTGMYQRTY